MNQNNKKKYDLTCELMSSLIKFTQCFYKERTGRKFELSFPDGRISHYIEIADALHRVIKGECNRLIINVPPRYGKTEMLIHFVAWALARYPDSNFLYVSYSHSLAKKQTYTIKQIIQLLMYDYFFDVKIKDDVSAKDNFEVSTGGSVYAAGAGGTITGRGAGIKNSNHFGGCIVVDDIHKPDEVTSDTIREGINDWYYNTLQSRVNSRTTPIIFIGQRLHEDDLVANLIKTNEWETLIIPAIDVAGNALHPQMHDIKTLRKMQHENPYVFAAQYQQDPQPAGGGIFKTEWFPILEHEPQMLATFLTIDTAETDKDYNDATVFSFWGIYDIKIKDVETGQRGLHCIDCLETRIEPKDLENTLFNFYAGCMRYKVKPSIVAIEKKSTGVTLASVLKRYPGMRIIDIERTKASGSKTTRFLEAQPYVAQRLVSLSESGRHTEMFVEHMRKITANNSHRFDDICDTMCDAIKLSLIDGTIVPSPSTPDDYNKMAKNMMSGFNRIDQMKKKAYE